MNDIEDLVQRAHQLDTKIAETGPDFEALTEYGHLNRRLIIGGVVAVFVLAAVGAWAVARANHHVDQANRRADAAQASLGVVIDDVKALRAQSLAHGISPVAPDPDPTIVAARGESGVAGERGPQGDIGPAGRAPTGAEIAAAVVEFCSTGLCRGEPGQDGTDGVAGPAGADGAPGANGVAGPAGPPGTNGINGVDGVAGAAGVDGAPGQPGAPGAQGPPGPPPSSFTFTTAGGTTFTCTPTPADPASFDCTPQGAP